MVVSKCVGVGGGNVERRAGLIGQEERAGTRVLILNSILRMALDSQLL